MLDQKNEISLEQQSMSDNISEDVEQRLDLLEQNLDLKKRIQDSLKTIGGIHQMVKDVFK